MAFETKDVKMEELNDSQAIGMCIYNVFILSAIGVALNFILTEKNEILYIATSAILLVCAPVSFICHFMKVIHRSPRLQQQQRS